MRARREPRGGKSCLQLISDVQRFCNKKVLYFCCRYVRNRALPQIDPNRLLPFLCTVRFAIHRRHCVTRHSRECRLGPDTNVYSEGNPGLNILGPTRIIVWMPPTTLITRSQKQVGRYFLVEPGAPIQLPPTYTACVPLFIILSQT